MSKEIIDEINAFKRGEYIGGDPEIESEIEQFKKEEFAKNARAVAEPIYGETFEGKYLQPIYDVAEPALKGLSLLEKPLSVSMAAGRSLGKAITGQENPEAPIVEEATSFFPTPAGSLFADLNEAEIGTEPLLEGAIPEGIKSQLPRASAFIENISPNTIAETLASGVAGKAITSGAKASRAGLIEGDVPLAEKALIRGGKTDDRFVGDLKSSGKMTSVINKVLSDKSLLKSIDDPTKMVERLQGVNREITDPLTGRRTSVPVVVGKIDEAGNKVSSALSKLSSKVPETKVDDMVTEIVNEIMDDVNRVGSGIDVSPEAVKKEISKYIKQPHELDMFDFESPATVSAKDLVSIKRGAADQLYKIKQVMSDVDTTNVKEIVADKIWKKASDKIDNIAEMFNDFELLKANNDYSDFQKLRDLYANKDIAQTRVPSLFENLLPAGLVGIGTAGVTGNPYMGVLAAGGFQGARSTIGSMADDAPAMALKARRGVIEPALRDLSLVKPGVIGMGLAAYKIPRNSDQILEQSDMFIAKLAQEIRTPDQKILFDEVLDVVTNRPDELSTLLPVIQQSYPNSFKLDKYNRINGYIADPILKQKAIEDMIKKGGSPLESAKRTERLINDNYLED